MECIQKEFAYISQQSNTDDMDVIERCYYKNNCNSAETILELLSIPMTTREIQQKTRVKTITEDIREILDDKEAAYKKAMDLQKTYIRT